MKGKYVIKFTLIVCVLDVSPCPFSKTDANFVCIIIPLMFVKMRKRDLFRNFYCYSFMEFHNKKILVVFSNKWECLYFYKSLVTILFRLDFYLKLLLELECGRG